LLPELLATALTCPDRLAVRDESPPPQLTNSNKAGSSDSFRMNGLTLKGFNNFCDITIFLNQEGNT
jgi:hypothetical protein